MDIYRKKTIILGLDTLLVTASGKETPEDITDFRIRKDILDQFKAHNMQKMVIVHDKDEREYLPLLKAVEFFVFVYCKAAVLSRHTEDVADAIPNRKESVLSLDKEMSEFLIVDYMEPKDFLAL